MPNKTVNIGASQNELSSASVRQASTGIPNFEDNLKVDATGGGIVSGSGDRAAANAFSEMADFSKGISDLATKTYQKQYIDQIQRGEISEADLPDPVTTVGENVRKAFVESQAIQTNIDIKGQINNITNNPNLGEAAMIAALKNSADAMVGAHIPEMAKTIRDMYATQGVGAVYNASKERLDKQREEQDFSLKEQQKYWAGEYSQAYSAVMTNKQRAADLQEQMKAGPVTQDVYMAAVTGIDSTAEKRLADATANFSKTLGTRMQLGKIDGTLADIYSKGVMMDARDEYLANHAVDKGLHVLDAVSDLSFDDKLRIAQKASNYAGMKVNEDERNNRLQKEEQDTRWNQNLQVAKDAAYKGDFRTARSITQQLAVENESVGSKDLMSHLDSVNKDIDVLGTMGGAPHPELYNDYKRQILTGNFKSMDDVMQDLRFTGNSLNQKEVQDLQDTVGKVPGTVLSSPSFRANQKLIKLRLPDSNDSPSAIERALTGAKKSPQQQLVENERNRVNDLFISGALDGTLKTPQQQSDFIDREIKSSKRNIYADDVKALKDYGLETNSSVVDINNKVNITFPDPVKDDGKRKELFNRLVRSQQRARQAE